jgi:uracil-DNA glycosylase
MGLCYPGPGNSGGDNPPRPECAPRWHQSLLTRLPELQLTLLVGQYAQRYYLTSKRKASLTETVKAFVEYGPQFFPLPHPSWRSALWMKKNPWFEETVIPAVRDVVQRVLANSGHDDTRDILGQKVAQNVPLDETTINPD